MKKVNLFGYTTAEKLILLEEAYDEVLQSLLANATPKGEYAPNTVYTYGDMVNYDDGSYIYYNENNSADVPPPNAEYWFMLAGRGENGQSGTPAFMCSVTMTIGTPLVGMTFMTNVSNIVPSGIAVGDYFFAICSRSDGSQYAAICKVNNIVDGVTIQGSFTAINKISGEKGDPGPKGESVYSHLINFTVAFDNGGGIVSLLWISKNSTPISDFLTFSSYINTSCDGKYYPMSTERMEIYTLIKCDSANAGSAIVLSSGIGSSGAPTLLTVNNSMVTNFSDTVL